MATVGNNDNQKYADLRDSFFSESEREHFNEVMKNPEERAIHAEMLKQKASELYRKAMDLIVRVERGEFNDEQMEKVEYQIAHYLAGIVDFEKTLEKEDERER